MRSSLKTVALGLALLACHCLLIAGEEGDDGETAKSHWTEYSYPRHGFAITLPQPPEGPGGVSGTLYTLYWNGSRDDTTRIVVELTAKASIDCASWLTNYRKVLNSPDPFKTFPMENDNIKMHEVTIAGNPAFDGEFSNSGWTRVYLRRQCLNGTLFDFYALWPRRQPKPTIVDRIFDSFRLIPSKIKQ